MAPAKSKRLTARSKAAKRKPPPDLRRDFAAAMCMGAILQRMPYHESFPAWEQQLLGAAKRAKLAANVLLAELDREEPA